MPDSPDVTEVEGEASEGKVLQAIAGEGNLYVMVIFEMTDGEDGPELSIRVPSNASPGVMRAMLERTAGML